MSDAVGRSRWVGRVLRDKWRIDARIARGGVGTVFAATHRNNGSRVAIKVLHTTFSRDDDTRSRFLQEGYAANQVNHPGVVRILDDDVTEEGLAFLVMELLEGELLEKRRVRKGGTLPLSEVYEIADQLLDVLASAHDKGIVHRDVKPDNLFITTEGRLKVLDFGFAQMKSGFRTEQTATGFLLGTPGFMSPEQAVGNRAQMDAQTDIWAVGATLFTLASGHPVHDAESAAEMLVAAANFPARSLATVAPGAPPKLVDVVDRALAFDKADRWPSARAMQNALRAVPGLEAPRGVVNANRRSMIDERELDDAEELDDVDLVDVNGSWQTDPRTMPSRAAPDRDEHVPSPVTARPPRPPESAPQDEPTLAELPRDDEEDAPDTERPPARRPSVEPPTIARRAPAPPPPPSSSAGVGDTTLIMDSNPALSGAGGSGPYAPVSGAPPSPGAPHAPILGTPNAFSVDRMRMSQPDYRRSFHDEALAAPAAPQAPLAPQAPAAPPRGRASRVLVFVAVAALSMIVVVVAGLLVLGAAE